MIQDTALNDAIRRPPHSAPGEAELAQACLIALNLARETAAAPADAPQMQALAERAAAIESLLRQVLGERTTLA
jgi:hypothetical protein